MHSVISKECMISKKKRGSAQSPQPCRSPGSLCSGYTDLLPLSETSPHLLPQGLCTCPPSALSPLSLDIHGLGPPLNLHSKSPSQWNHTHLLLPSILCLLPLLFFWPQYLSSSNIGYCVFIYLVHSLFPSEVRD